MNFNRVQKRRRAVTDIRRSHTKEIFLKEGDEGRER
jgi:hypothetical protein